MIMELTLVAIGPWLGLKRHRVGVGSERRRVTILGRGSLPSRLPTNRCSSFKPVRFG